MKSLIQTPVNSRIPSLKAVNDKPIVSGILFFMNQTKFNDQGTPLCVAKCVGKKYNMLTVLFYIKRVPNGKSYNYFVLCKCECGIEKVLNLFQLRIGKPISCGCYSSKLKSARFSKHGMSRSRLYVKHQSMHDRCYNPNATHYHLYGGKGVVICAHWHGADNFTNFLNDMGVPKKGYDTIDRINSNGNYSCGHCDECLKNGWTANCRWADYGMQGRNTSRNKFISINGNKMTVSEASRKFNISESIIAYRLKNGWSEKESVSIPTQGKRYTPNKHIMVMVNNKKMSMAEAEKLLGYSHGLISNRIKRGWSKEKAVNIKP